MIFFKNSNEIYAKIMANETRDKIIDKLKATTTKFVTMKSSRERVGIEREDEFANEELIAEHTGIQKVDSELNRVSGFV
jgi:hypothetical protein